MQQPVNTIRRTTIAIGQTADRISKLILGETIPKGAVIVALHTRRAGANRRTLGGKTIVNDANFDAAAITLKKGSENVLEHLHLEHIERASNVTPEQGFPVQLHDIDWNTSFIEVEEGVALNSGNYFELTISYYLPKK